MPSRKRDIIVIGTSAGGLEALDALIGQLPADLSATIFIVQHMAPEMTGDGLLNRLNQHKAFGCKLASNGESFKRGRIYIAPPDSHLLLKKSTVLVTKGARENRNRPGIDPLFRSAAVSHGARVIGVVLTGMLDDGTAGLTAIKACGGVTVVQDPKDAAYPGMPESALRNLGVDHCVAVAQMGQLLVRLTQERCGQDKPVPADIRTEAKIAERVLSDVGRSTVWEIRCRITVPTAEGFSGKWTAPPCGDIAATQAIHLPSHRCLQASPKKSRKRCGYRSECSKNARIY